MELMVKAMKTKVGSPLRKLVLIKLADNASDIGECWPSYQHIADQCEISRRSVMSHVTALIETGLLRKEIRTGGPKGNTSNFYMLNVQKLGVSTPSENAAPGGKKSRPTGEAGSPPSENPAPGGETDAPGGGEGDSPRTSHSSESVIEPVSERLPPDATASGGELILAGEEVAEQVVVTTGKPRIQIPADMPGPKDQECTTFKTWANYAFAYRKRYAVWPLWNQTVAGKLGQLIKRVGAEVAPKIAAFYLSDNDAFVVKAGHSVGLLLSGAEKYHTAWQRGRTMTTTEAAQIDKTQTNMNAAGDAQALLRERRAARASSANANS